MTTRVKTYDARCYQLADWFLSQTSDLNSDKAKNSLALEIQQTVQDEIEFMRDGLYTLLEQSRKSMP